MATHRYLYMSILNVASNTCQIVGDRMLKKKNDRVNILTHAHIHNIVVST